MLSSTGRDWARLPQHLGMRATRGRVPQRLVGAAEHWPWADVGHEAALVRFREDVRMLVENGRDITVEWDDAFASDADPSWIVQGWGVTLAWLQRGHLSLHASTMLVDDVTVAVAGSRGAGKSTTMLGLHGRGHRLLVDDVTLVETAGGVAWTTPYQRNVHLTPEAAASIGLDFDELPRLAGGRTKAAVRADEPPTERRRLDAVVVLEPCDAGKDPTDPELDRLRGARCLAALVPHTDRDGMAPAALGQVRYFEQVTELASSVPVYSLRRPTAGWSLPKVLELIESLAENQRRFGLTRV